MKQIHFYKYQGTGNDFILFDNRAGNISLSEEQIKCLCDRRFGIGADGLMLLENSEDADFRMVYYNSDGGKSTMCGNGGRCIVLFAYQLGMIRDQCSFTAIDGRHKGIISAHEEVALKMIDVTGYEEVLDGYFINTGSPHFVKFVVGLEHLNVFEEGQNIRTNSIFAPGGTNVNFVTENENGIAIRTYERGVENETLSCGTGVVAASLIFALDKKDTNMVMVSAPGGNLSVSFEREQDGSYRNIWLTGKAKKVFEGSIMI